jgi:putative colanic acid biosynthesis acetyltransferase WcaF
MSHLNTDTHTEPSFTLKNRLMRVLWGIIYHLLFRFSPPPFHVWRSFLLRLFGAKVGEGVHVYPGARIWAPWNLVLEDQAGVASGATLYSQGLIHIGRRAVISQGSYLCAGTHDFEQPGFPLYTKPIHIGAEAWIAAEAFIHPGVTVGEGAVVGARSVVVKDLPPWMVCSGFPAKPLKERPRLTHTE